MVTQTAAKIYKEMKALRRETEALRDLVFLILKDPEGEYRDAFVKGIFKKARSTPRFFFRNRNEFLKQLVS